ncbi:hypothetical protein V6N11_080904 [Hibiscus sabdariffa]|uniref:Uncharacterized protein n=1 Tax=Hibiscus sabdariffa TaxID=183260 RepID=A0ABR2QI94_9ROSI
MLLGQATSYWGFEIDMDPFIIKDLPSIRWASRRLAWPLRKDDTHKSRNDCNLEFLLDLGLSFSDKSTGFGEVQYEFLHLANVSIWEIYRNLNGCGLGASM